LRPGPAPVFGAGRTDGGRDEPGCIARLRTRIPLALLVAVALVGGSLLPSALGSADPQPVSRTALAASDQVRGAPGRTMVLSKVVVRPGAELALHRHRGTQISRVVAGTLTYTVERGSASLHEGDAEAAPRLVRRIRAGQTAQVSAGQWLVEQPGDVHRAANRGSTPIVIYLATLLRSGAPPSTPVAG
jgi:quercetin dioxygenase-like cupin family protein